ELTFVIRLQAKPPVQWLALTPAGSRAWPPPLGEPRKPGRSNHLGTERRFWLDSMTGSSNAIRRFLTRFSLRPGKRERTRWRKSSRLPGQRDTTWHTVRSLSGQNAGVLRFR